MISITEMEYDGVRSQKLSHVGVEFDVNVFVSVLSMFTVVRFLIRCSISSGFVVLGVRFWCGNVLQCYAAC